MKPNRCYRWFHDGETIGDLEEQLAACIARIAHAEDDLKRNRELRIELQEEIDKLHRDIHDHVENASD